MSSLSPKDRVSLCSFTFSDGRRCQTPRFRNNPRFCPYHAQKEARARTVEKLGKDLDYFFSGNYLSACDLSTALARLIPAVVRGDVKPKTAHTVAYLVQTLMQAIHLSQHEYCEAFSSDAWRKSIRNSVNENYDYRFPPAPKPEPHTEQAPHVVAGLQTGRAQAPQPAPAAQPASQPAPPPHTSLPPTSAEFVQRVVAGLQTGSLPATPHVQPAPPNPQPTSPPKTTPSAPSAPTISTSATPSAPPQPQPHAQSLASQPVNPPEPRPSTSAREPNRDAPWLHFDDSRRIPPDSKLL